MDPKQPESLPPPELVATTPKTALLPGEQPGERAARRYAAARRAFQTKKAYRSAFAQFAAWCAAGGCRDAFGSDITDQQMAERVARYLADRADMGRKVSTVMMDLVAINQGRKSRKLASVRNFDCVQAILEGIQVEHEGPKAATALLPDDLRAVIGTFSGDIWGVRNKALILVGFCLGMRREEVCGLRIENLVRRPDHRGYNIHLTHSKTDQKKKGRWIHLPLIRGDLCPASALMEWIRLSGIASGSIFRPISRRKNGMHKMGEDAISGADLRRILLKAVNACRLKERVMEKARHDGDMNLTMGDLKFSSHSLRAGYVTYMRSLGVHWEDIMHTTGHSTEAMVRRYNQRGRVRKQNPLTEL